MGENAIVYYKNHVAYTYALPPLSSDVEEHKGSVRAVRDIAAGTLLGYYAGTYRPAHLSVRGPRCFEVKGVFVVDARKCGNLLRLVRDCGDAPPNVAAAELTFEREGHTFCTLEYRAARAVLSGEELTLKYGAGEWPSKEAEGGERK